MPIPSGDAAGAAWAALPPEVRAEVVERAARFEGHPDPAVAAVTVGYIRAEAERPWRLHVITHAAMAVFLGIYLAGYGQPAENSTFLPFVVGAIAGVFAVAASRWRSRPTIPRGAEAANLAVFLDSPDATARDDRSSREFWARTGIAAAVYAVGIPLAGWLCVRAFGLDLDLAALRRPATPSAVILILVLGLRFLLENAHRPKHWARRVSVGENGVQFGRPWILPWTPTVPWSDVVDATLDGPSQFRPREAGVVVWHLRDGLQVRVALHGSRREPEELILAARSYMVTASVARTA